MWATARQKDTTQTTGLASLKHAAWRRSALLVEASGDTWRSQGLDPYLARSVYLVPEPFPSRKSGRTRFGVAVSTTLRFFWC